MLTEQVPDLSHLSMDDLRHIIESPGSTDDYGSFLWDVALVEAKRRKGRYFPSWLRDIDDDEADGRYKAALRAPANIAWYVDTKARLEYKIPKTAYATLLIGGDWCMQEAIRQAEKGERISIERAAAIVEFDRCRQQLYGSDAA